jgi:hypothetical protein
LKPCRSEVRHCCNCPGLLAMSARNRQT